MSDDRQDIVPKAPIKPTAITVGFGANKTTVWDPGWDQQTKSARLSETDPTTVINRARQMTKFLATPEGTEDFAAILNRATQSLGNWTRAELNALRSSLIPMGSLSQQVKEAASQSTRPLLPAIEAAVRAKVNAVDTGGSPTQRKTPAGNTRVINMNYVMAGSGARDDVEYAHAQFFVSRAQQLGLSLCIFTTAAGQADLLGTHGFFGNLNVVWTIADNTVNKEAISKWAEDSVEFLQSGHVAVLEKFDSSLLTYSIGAGRRERWANLLGQEFADLRESPFISAMSGDWVPEGTLVNVGDSGLLRAVALTNHQRTVRHLRFYAEGGNLIVGENAAQQTIVLVGKDSIAMTRSEYAFTSDDAVRQLIADDFGLNLNQIIGVEQPGTFHLDMGLLFLGSGQVLVNDSTQALADARAARQPDRQLTALLTLRCGLEHLAQQDLAAAGLNVERRKLENGTDFNFFNGEFVTDGNGHVHYLTNGPKLKEDGGRFRDLLVNEKQVVAEVHFSPATAAMPSLKGKGGVGCRIKGASRPDPI